MDHHTALKLVQLQLACLKTSGCAEFGPLNMKESDVLAQNVFSQKQITWKLQALKLVPLIINCTIAIGTPENFRVCWVWPSKYEGKWCFSPKCVFSETDHHTALKLVPLQLAHLKTSGCTEFGPLNMKESDVLAQNVFSQKWIIIKLWNFVSLQLALTPENRVHRVCPLNTKESNVLAQNVFSPEMDHHTALKLVPLQMACLKIEGVPSLAL